MSATEADIARRAGALCIVAEPHEDKTEWPCRRHLDEARRQLNPTSAVASASSGAAARLHSGDADGAAGRDRRSVAAPPSNNNSPGTSNPRGAEGATAIARTEGTR